MKVKKYTAPTMPEAMNLIRKELGSDAVILNSKVVKTRGFLGFFQKNNIEVIAAMDPHPAKKKQLEDVRKKPAPTLPDQQKPTMNKAQEDLLLEEIRKLSSKLDHQKETGNNNYPAPISKVYDYLQSQDLDNHYVQAISDSLLERYFVNQKQCDNEAIREWLQEEIENRIQHLSFGDDSITKKIIHFVGPTGVGKTTTIAKIAAHLIMKENKKVALITMDTYRIGAIDQLKTYSKILDIPLEIAYNYEDFVNAKKKLADFDIILVDTAGRNYKQVEFINQLSESIDYQEEDAMYLVLSITTKYKELQQIFKQFSSFSIEKVIFTKIDETNEYGPMLNMILNCQVGVAFMTNGQSVPDDLLIASNHRVSSMLVGGFEND
jgi:flagellar biosynthesis protein FlhF